MAGCVQRCDDHVPLIEQGSRRRRVLQVPAARGKESKHIVWFDLEVEIVSVLRFAGYVEDPSRF